MPIQTRYLFSAADERRPDKDALFNEVYDKEHVPSCSAYGRHRGPRAQERAGHDDDRRRAQDDRDRERAAYNALYEIESPACSQRCLGEGRRGRALGGARPSVHHEPPHVIYRRIFVANDRGRDVSRNLHPPRPPSGDGLVLTHGAGGSARAPLRVALAERFAAKASRCSATTFPSASRARRSAPNRRARPRTAKDCAARCLDAGQRARRVFLGGSRTEAVRPACSRRASPGSSTRSCCSRIRFTRRAARPSFRTAHLPQLKTPALFAHGSRDRSARSRDGGRRGA